MNPLDIASTLETVVAYGQSGSGWAASKINTWLGVILAVIFMISSAAILRDDKKEEGQKVKSVALLAICVFIVAAVAMMFINNQFGGAVGKVSEFVN